MVTTQPTNIIPLYDAPFDCPLELFRIENKYLAAQLQKMGLFIGNEISRLDESLIAQAVRIRTKTGEVVLSGGMGIKTIIHLPNNRRIPLLDMEPGESGHIEGTTGGHSLAQTLVKLGLKNEEEITLIRKLPPMEYTTRLDHGRLLQLTEGDAARILGESHGRTSQFSFASIHNDFQVCKLLGGNKALSRLQHIGITNDSILTLVSVSSAQPLHLDNHNQLVISSPDGLHLHLPQQAGQMISVRLSH